MVTCSFTGEGDGVGCAIYVFDYKFYRCGISIERIAHCERVAIKLAFQAVCVAVERSLSRMLQTKYGHGKNKQ